MSVDQVEIADGVARFTLGAFSGTIVADGPIILGPVHESFAPQVAEEVQAVLAERGDDGDSFVMDQNLLVIDTPDGRVLFDTGTGDDPAFGRLAFGSTTGFGAENLRAAGIDPASIDVVAISHGHPDHCWGLVDAAGERVFPNARIAISRAEYEWSTDQANLDQAPSDFVAHRYAGSIRNLTAYADRLFLLESGDTVVPGVTALDASGHTPGHLAYLIESEGERLCAWGDLCHHRVLLEHPRWPLAFDDDTSAAGGRRAAIFESLHETGSAVLGYHFPFPGLGRLERFEKGFTWSAV